MLPQHEGAAPGSTPDQPQDQAPQGGITEKLVALDKQLYQVVGAISQADVPDEVKAPFQSALEAFRAGLSALTSMADGGKGQAQPGAVAPEQGAAQGAVPMSHGRR